MGRGLLFRRRGGRGIGAGGLGGVAAERNGGGGSADTGVVRHIRDKDEVRSLHCRLLQQRRWMVGAKGSRSEGVAVAWGSGCAVRAVGLAGVPARQGRDACGDVGRVVENPLFASVQCEDAPRLTDEVSW